MQAGDGGEVRMLKAYEGEGELENEEEEKEGGETDGFPGVAGGEGEHDENEDGGGDEEDAVDAMEGREGVVSALPDVVGGDVDGERGGNGDDCGGDEVELSEEEEKYAEGRICLDKEAGGARVLMAGEMVTVPVRGMTITEGGDKPSEVAVAFDHDGPVAFGDRDGRMFPAEDSNPGPTA